MKSMPSKLISLPVVVQGRGCRLISVCVIMAFLSLWIVRVTGSVEWRPHGYLLVFVLVCLAYGNAFLGRFEFVSKSGASVIFDFLCGFFLFNTLLFVLCLISRFGMTVNFLLLILIGAGLFVGVSRNRSSAGNDERAVSELLCLITSGAAVTIWCSDAQTFPVVKDRAAVYQVWKDTFFHFREISTFAQAQGWATLHDNAFAQAPKGIYHYGSYISGAAISAVGGLSAADAYLGFQLPLGIFLSGLAAFALIYSFWGGWPALAATMAVLLLPDGYQQGFGNRYLGFNFLSQISPGMPYGIACAALTSPRSGLPTTSRPR